MKAQRERVCVCTREREKCDLWWGEMIECDSKNVGRNFIGRRVKKRNSNNRKVDVVGACWLRYEL